MPSLRSLTLAFAGAVVIASIGCKSHRDAAPVTEPIFDDNDDWGDEVRSRTDEQVRADIEAAAEGALYTSEGDFPYAFVSARLAPGTRVITEDLVRALLADAIDSDPDADKPLASLHGESVAWAAWSADVTDCDADGVAESCAATRALVAALGRNLRSIQVFYFGSRGAPGAVEGTAVTILVVGRTPKGNLAGVRTIAIWT